MQTGTFVTIVLARGSFSTSVTWYGVAWRTATGVAQLSNRATLSSLSLSLRSDDYVVERLNRIL